MILHEHILILILLVQVILDAVGDGARDRGWQRVHHDLEAIREGIWLALLVLTGFQLIDFQWYLILVYIFGRIWAFDPINNLIAKRPIGYVGETSIDGIIYNAIANLFKAPVENASFIFKFMALLAWIASLIGMFNPHY